LSLCRRACVFFVGDVCYYDEKERFFIVDRIKEIIKYKGFQVSYSFLFFSCSFCGFFILFTISLNCWPTLYVMPASVVAVHRCLFSIDISVKSCVMDKYPVTLISNMMTNAVWSYFEHFTLCLDVHCLSIFSSFSSYFALDVYFAIFLYFLTS